MPENPQRVFSLSELEERSGVGARNIRFYTSRGILPVPERSGRSAVYSQAHLARLELIRELQAHGFTLAAIESYLGKLPQGATPESIGLHRTLLTPWMSDRPEIMQRHDLQARAGRDLSDSDLEVLTALGVVSGSGPYEVAPALLSLGVGLLDLGMPVDAARRAGEIFDEHGRAAAEELTDLFRTSVWPAYKASGMSASQAQDIVARFKPLTVGALVSAYERAVDDAKRATAERRARGGE